jgi:hypothetical protein
MLLGKGWLLNFPVSGLLLLVAAAAAAEEAAKVEVAFAISNFADTLNSNGQHTAIL